MPKITRAKRSKTPPEEYKKIQPTMAKLKDKLKEAQSKSLKSEDKISSLWPIYRLNHLISRYVYTMYQKNLIGLELYQWMLGEPSVDRDLIAKWKKPGYENLCCVQCIVTSDKNHGKVCICRVKKTTLADNDQDEDVECRTCGCKGCASGD